MRLIFILALLVALFSSCGDSNVTPGNEPNLRPLSVSEVQVATATNDFAFNLSRQLQEGTPQNNFISPLSVSMALGMTLNGASTETQESILQAIDYGGLSPQEVNAGYKDLTGLLLSMDRKVTLGIANSVWYTDKYHAKETFTSLIDEYYDGKVSALNFSDNNSKNVINKWVEDKTNDRIKNLIDHIEPNEVMFLVNAIYFKGDWTYRFDKSKTHDAPFHKIDGSTTSVDMMQAEKVTMLRYWNDEIQLLDIPYGNKQFSLTLIVPHQSDKILDVLHKLNSEHLSYWLSEADSVSPEFELPKFKMTWRKDLKETLEEMGMKTEGFPDLFEEQLDLEITRVIHQTFLDVNEEGTEAAAATAVGIGETSAGPPTKITVDKPFIFLLREKHSGTILFMGQLIDPDAL